MSEAIAQLVGKEDIDDLIDSGWRVKLDEHGNVLVVDLWSMGFTGPIPEAVGKWTSATSIDLKINQLTAPYSKREPNPHINDVVTILLPNKLSNWSIAGLCVSCHMVCGDAQGAER